MLVFYLVSSFVAIPHKRHSAFGRNLGFIFLGPKSSPVVALFVLKNELERFGPVILLMIHLGYFGSHFY